MTALALKKVFCAVQSLHKKRHGVDAKLLVMRSPHAITLFHVVDGDSKQAPVQVILLVYNGAQVFLALSLSGECWRSFTNSTRGSEEEDDELRMTGARTA